MSDAQPLGLVMNGDAEPQLDFPRNVQAQQGQDQVVAVAGGQAVPLQQVMNEDGEDVEMSGMIKQLHNETVAFFAAQTYVNPVVPRFYYISVYYLYKMDLKKGLRPVKLYELAELVKRSIQDACPHLIVPEFPSLQQVVEALQYLEGGTRESAEGQNFSAFREFSCVFVNYLVFAKALYERDRSPPPYMHFLHQFCILFYKFNSGTIENKYQWKICELMRPQFPSLPSAHFNCIYTAITKFVQNYDLFVTFSPRSL
ncbi:unnamed protein product [Caenorhabditis brenneri]